jgi:hypothetical protein
MGNHHLHELGFLDPLVALRRRLHWALGLWHGQDKTMKTPFMRVGGSTVSANSCPKCETRQRASQVEDDAAYVRKARAGSARKWLLGSAILGVGGAGLGIGGVLLAVIIASWDVLLVALALALLVH